MMTTTSIIYENNFNSSAQEFLINFATGTLKSAYISSLNFGLRDMMRKEDNGNLIGGLIGGVLDRHLRQPHSINTSLLMGALNGGIYELFRSDIRRPKPLFYSIGIFSLIEGVDSLLCNFFMGSETGTMFKSVATSMLLGAYLATCINKLTVPYGDAIKKPLVSFKDRTLESFSSFLYQQPTAVEKAR
jgi:hypothetical protein